MLFAKLNELKSKYLSKRLIYATDVFLSVLASVVVLLTVNLLDTSRSFAGRHILLYSILSAGISAVTLLLTRCYRIIIRHLGIKDLVRFATAAIGKVLLVAVAMFAFGRFSYAIGIVLVLDFFLTFFLLIGVRILMIVAYDIVNQRILERNEFKRVLVYGLSDKSVASIVRLHSSPHYKVLGFLMPGRTGKGGMIDQLPIINFENEDDINAILSDYGVNAILFAKETDAQAEEDRLIKICSHRGIKCLIMPSVDEVVEGQTIIRPREIKVEDLLGRNEIKISMEKIIENFKDKVVMVTGAAGSIGSELCRQLAGFGIKRLILFDNAETPMHNLRLELEDNYPNLDFVPVIGDVRQIPRLDFAFRTYKPQVVFHAAAYKHVPLMEENPCEAVLVNVIGSRQVADKCIEYGVEKMVMISTDKAVNPTNIMGCTKRLAEIYVQSLGLALQNGTVKGKTTFVTTRFGNVLGSNGSVIPRFREQ
ncbi:MAG: polysaccharide biosynthesis protein, partial [Bacteroidales bacterium]|nr:polysaccharide biosynthesis protein [Bacteroidales bacterium]